VGLRTYGDQEGATGEGIIRPVEHKVVRHIGYRKGEIARSPLTPLVLEILSVYAADRKWWLMTGIKPGCADQNLGLVIHVGIVDDAGRCHFVDVANHERDVGRGKCLDVTHTRRRATTSYPVAWNDSLFVQFRRACGSKLPLNLVNEMLTYLLLLWRIFQAKLEVAVNAALELFAFLCQRFWVVFEVLDFVVTILSLRFSEWAEDPCRLPNDYSQLAREGLYRFQYLLSRGSA
jgi:hypothetical protein